MLNNVALSSVGDVAAVNSRQTSPFPVIYTGKHWPWGKLPQPVHNLPAAEASPPAGCSSGPDTQCFHQPIRDRLSLPVLQHHMLQEAGTSQRKLSGCTPANGAVTQPV